MAPTNSAMEALLAQQYVRASALLQEHSVLEPYADHLAVFARGHAAQSAGSGTRMRLPLACA